MLDDKLLDRNIVSHDSIFKLESGQERFYTFQFGHFLVIHLVEQVRVFNNLH